MPNAIGLIVWNLAGHGVARVVTHLLPIFKALGVRVVLLTDSGPSEDAFVIDGSAQRVVIGNLKSTSRSVLLENAIKDYNLDLLVSHEYCSDPWRIDKDLEIAHKCGIKFVIHHHNVFTAGLVSFERRRRFTNWLKVYRKADALIALSRVDACYFNAIGCRAFYIQNPVDMVETKSVEVAERKKTVVWIARLDPIKGLQDAIRIFARVAKRCPDADLCVLGPITGAYKGEYEKALGLAKREGVESRVRFEGFRPNVNDYLRRSRVLLMTSSFEGWGCVIPEANANDCPVVCYDLPWIECIRGQDGVVSVPQGDISRATDEVLRLLEDDMLWSSRSQAAKSSYEAFRAYDTSGRYVEFFRWLMAGVQSEDLPSIEDYKLAIRTMTDHLCIAMDDVLSGQYRKKMMKKYGGVVLQHPVAALRSAFHILGRKLHLVKA